MKRQRQHHRQRRYAAPRRARYTRALLRIGWWAMAIAYVAAVIYVFFYASYTRVTHVIVEGVERIPHAVVMASVHAAIAQQPQWQRVLRMPAGQYVTVPSARIAAAVRARNPAARTVTVEKIFPATVRVVVQEWERVVLWCAAQCRIISDDGILGDVVSDDAPLLQVVPVERIVETNAPARSAGMRVPLRPTDIVALRAAARAVGWDIASFTTPHILAPWITIMTQDGVHISVALSPTPAARLRWVHAALTAALGADAHARLMSVDARFAQKIFYVVRGEDEDAASAE